MVYPPLRAASRAEFTSLDTPTERHKQARVKRGENRWGSQQRSSVTTDAERTTLAGAPLKERKPRAKKAEDAVRITPDLDRYKVSKYVRTESSQ